MEPKKAAQKRRDRILATTLVILLFIIATLAPCIVIYMFAAAGT